MVRDSNLKVEKRYGFPDSRGQSILTAIINEHFVTGEPVGSKTIAERFANASGLSSASIRSVMGELEELGLLEQPHTSAGRVPTDKGYRFYVDNLLGVLSISNDDLHRIGGEFGLNESDLVETPEGKAAYVRAQRSFAERGAPLRARLVAECERLLDVVRTETGAPAQNS